MVDLYKWANYNRIGIAFFDHYFDRTTGKKGIHHLESLTRMYLPEGSKKQFIEPDGVCILETPKGRKLYVFELHRGYGAERLLEQIRVHQVIIREGIAMKKYGSEKNNRVIVVCEKRATEVGILNKLKEEAGFRPYGNYFVFKHLEDEKSWEVEQFGEGRKNGLGEIVSLY